MIRVKRAYDAPAPADGTRVLVDRLWPRGVSRNALHITAWLPDLGPSTALRNWFGHDPKKWGAFRRRYLVELDGKRPLLRQLAAYARRGTLTLVYGARDREHNQAVVIKEALERRGRVQTGGSRSARSQIQTRPQGARERPSGRRR